MSRVVSRGGRFASGGICSGTGDGCAIFGCRTTIVPATRSPSRCRRLVKRIRNAPRSSRRTSNGRSRLRSSTGPRPTGWPSVWMTRSPNARFPGVWPFQISSKNGWYPKVTRRRKAA